MRAARGCLLGIIAGTLLWIAFLGVIAFMMGCGASGGEQMDHGQLVAEERTGQPEVAVIFDIVHREDGTGNEDWTDDYIQQLLAEAQRLAGGAVTFTLSHAAHNLMEGWWHFSQGQLLQAYEHNRYASRHVINVIISPPDTEDSAGVSRPYYAHTPLFVMRARLGGTLTETARIFLHELGHNMGLAHKSTPFYQDGLTTDNYWLHDAGRQLLSLYINDITTN